jgi:transcriptional regulator with XRE-family HTH domain
MGLRVEFPGMDTLATRLVQERKKRGWKQETLAKKAGIPWRQLSCYECAKIQPSLGSLYWLAEALGVSLDYLVGRSPEPDLLDQDAPAPEPA